MMAGRAAALALLLASCLLPATASAAARRVWAVNDGEKVERDDLGNPSARANSAWDGRVVRIFGARNEVIAFQVVVEADARGIGRLSVALPELKRRGGGGRIAYAPPAADPTDTVGRPIQLFSVNYMNVTTPSHAEWVYAPGSPAALPCRGWRIVTSARTDRTGGFPGNRSRSRARRRCLPWRATSPNTGSSITSAWSGANSNPRACWPVAWRMTSTTCSRLSGSTWTW